MSAPLTRLNIEPINGQTGAGEKFLQTAVMPQEMTEQGKGNQLNEEKERTDLESFSQALPINAGQVEGVQLLVVKREQLIASVCYFFFSSTMLIVNKAALNSFPFPIFLAAIQTFATVVVLRALKFAGYLHFPPLQLKKVWSWKFVAVVWTVPFVCNFNALKHVRIEGMMMFRSSTVLFVAAIDCFVLGTTISHRQILACLMITVGGILYASNDVETSFLGWMWGSLYAAFQVLNSVYIKHIFNQELEMTTWEKTYLNNLTSLQLILLCASQEDTATASAQLSGLPIKKSLLVLLSCLGGFGTTYLISRTNFASLLICLFH